MLSATNHFNTDFSTKCARKYHGRTREGNGRPFCCPSLLSRRVCPWGCWTLVEQQVFLWSIAFINMISSHIWYKIECFHELYWSRDCGLLCNSAQDLLLFCFSGVQTSPIKWLHGYQANVSYRFPALSVIFISTVGFSNDENCCQSQGIGELIEGKLLTGIFRVD